MLGFHEHASLRVHKYFQIKSLGIAVSLNKEITMNSRFSELCAVWLLRISLEIFN